MPQHERFRRNSVSPAADGDSRPAVATAVQAMVSEPRTFSAQPCGEPNTWGGRGKIAVWDPTSPQQWMITAPTQPHLPVANPWAAARRQHTQQHEQPRVVSNWTYGRPTGCAYQRPPTCFG